MGVLTFVASGGYVLRYFEGTVNLHCYTSCTFTTLHCSKVTFLAVTWKDIIKHLQIFEGCTHFCEILCIYIYISGGPLSVLTCCVNVRLLSAIKKISALIYSQSWVGSWVYTTQAMMTFTLIF